MSNGEAEETIISADDFSTAIEMCCRDSEMQYAYFNAPYGARLYLGLVFYKRHFGTRADDQQIQDVLADIEPEIGIKDINYLLDKPVLCKEEKQYLGNLRETLIKQSESSAPSAEAASLRERIKLQKLDYEALKRMGESRRNKGKLVDAGVFLVKAVAAILTVCVAGWVVRITWNEVKKIEQQKYYTKQQEEFQRKISEMEVRVAIANNALRATEKSARTDRMRADEMKAKYDELKRVQRSEMEKMEAEYNLKLNEFVEANERFARKLSQLKRTSHFGGTDENAEKHDVTNTPVVRPDVNTPINANIPTL